MPKSLRQLREERGWTQFDLAAASHVSLSTITGIEAARQDVRIAQARKIASALGVSVDAIAWPEDIKRRPRPKIAA